MNQMTNQKSPDGIVLLAKQPGLTSFSSLYNIKKAFNTTKVGHTGTLDSFAQGLLVVCTGRMTRLAGNITEFDKTYKAIIKFGEETDTLELTGNVIRTAGLPTKKSLESSVNKFTGNLMQEPPAFSAIHIDGKRASDLARQGKSAQIPARPVIVYESIIEDLKNDNLQTVTDDNDFVKYALVRFKVSKGTYIRSLARDISLDCGSAGHLIGLYRTQVGNFCIEDAAAFSLLNDFTIENEVRNFDLKCNESIDKSNNDYIQKEILNKIQPVTETVCEQCGFYNVHLNSESSCTDFKNGKPIRSKYYDIDLHKIPLDCICSVFYEKKFMGLFYKDNEGKLSYKFVNN